MDDTIIAALIGAAATLPTHIVTYLQGRKSGSGKTRATIEEQTAEAGLSLTKTLRDLYGVTWSRIYDCTEVDWDGKAVVTRRMEGLQVAEGVTIPHMHGRVAGDEGRARHVRTDLTSLGDQTGLKHLRLEIIPTTAPSEVLYRVQISGGLSSSDAPLSYEIVSEFDNYILMSKEEVESAYGSDEFKEDYDGFAPQTPTDVLVLEVRFPVGFPEVKTFAGVFFGKSETIHARELARVQPGFVPNERGATFTIANPLVGFPYLIYWTMPTANVVNAHRESREPTKAVDQGQPTE